MSEVSVIIVADDTADLEQLKASLEERGFRALPKKEPIQHQIRQLQGKIEKGMVAELLKVPGVKSVEEERTYELPPPHSRVQ